MFFSFLIISFFADSVEHIKELASKLNNNLVILYQFHTMVSIEELIFKINK